MRNFIYMGLWLISSGLSNVFAITMPQFDLYHQAESYIASQPTESSITVGAILDNYKKLQIKWLGTKEAKINAHTIQTNPIFAKTILFDSEPDKNVLSATIKFIRLKYVTTNPDGKQNVSGLLILPPTSKPKGIVLFFHSTITGKLNVPSLKFNDYKSQMLAAVFAANGYIVVSPDYIGLGDNYKAIHPYIIYPQMNVEDGKDMLLATREYLVKHLHYTHTMNLFVSGYSEGASYALWFSRIYQENKLFAKQLAVAHITLQKTVPIDGAYNVTGVMFPFLLANQVYETSNPFKINTSIWGTLLKPSLLVQVMLGYSYYNHQNINRLLNLDFFTLQCNILPHDICGQNLTNQYNIDNIMLTPARTFTMALKYFFAANFKSGNGLIYSIFSNSIMPLMAPEAINDKLLYQTAAKANILSWKSKNPVTFISLAHDSLVPEQNSTDAYNAMLKVGSTNLKYLKIDNHLLYNRILWGSGYIDHISFELYALLIVLNEFNQIPFN